MAARVGVRMSEKGPGFKKLREALGGLASISLGVQGDEAKMQHENSELPIGAVAAIHELGLSGGHRTRRSWLTSWMDAHQEEMITDARRAMQAVVKGAPRRKAFEVIGYKWAQALRDNIDAGAVRPPLKESTKARKGHGIPLLESGDVRDAITYRVYLPRLKGGEGEAGYAAALAMAGHSLSGVLVKGSPQPPKGGRVRKLKIKQIFDAKNRSRAAFAKTVLVRAPRKPRVASAGRARGGSGRTRVSVGRTRGGGRAGRSFLKFLLRAVKKAARMFKGKKGSAAGYRNHGATGVRKANGKTGLAGR